MEKEKIIAECKLRMQMLGLPDDRIEDFENGTVLMSSTSEIKGENHIDGIGIVSDEKIYEYFLYKATDKVKEMITEFENKGDRKVYYVIRSETEFGDLYSLLYVSEHEEEWGMDRIDIKGNYIFSYVINDTADWCSEFGGISVERYGAILWRVG